ncbi:MAG TPA: phosphate ABC transporter ATP-binding protein PstB [Capsulimonadaceae bacterium]|nr:phosphate ABC transporter ATP-binding protein PstB [Capsulimonadaceae bacterium]
MPITLKRPVADWQDDHRDHIHREKQAGQQTDPQPNLIDPPAAVAPAPHDAQPPPSGPVENAIEVEALDFYYGNNHALKDINIAIPARQITALIGPSGCGKSTFLRCLNRMNDTIDGTRTTGRVLMDRHNINSLAIDVVALRKRVGMVFQKPVPFPMSIYDNIAYGPRIHGIRGKKALDEIVARTLRQSALWNEVRDNLRQSAFALSGGQQQRLCIARVLAVEPEIILMDEPCSALDPTSTHRIEEMMQELKERYTIIIVTHNLQQAVRVSSKTGFFLKGELKEFGDTTQIFNSPQNPETDAYVNGRFG